MSIRIVAALAMLAAVPGAVPAAATAEDQVPQIALGWQSSGSDATLASELARLYLTLHNSGNLAVRQAPLTDGYVETLLRTEGVVGGTYFPIELDALMCDLNPAVCTRIRDPAPEDSLGDPTAHVGGYVATPGQWRAKPGDVVTIPDYAFGRLTSLTRVPAPRGFTPQGYAPPADADCSAWKLTCAEVVERFNPPQIKMQGSDPSVTVPVVQWTTTVPLKRDDASLVRGLILAPLDQSPANPDQPAPAKSFADVDPTFSGAWKSQIGAQSPTDLTVRSLKGNLAPIGTINSYGVTDEPLAREQAPLFQLINHPFAQLQELPPELRAPVGIAVFESHLDKGHCDLPEMSRADGTMIEPPVAGQPNSCDRVDALSETDADHAAGVAGVIASQENGKGIVGLNPAAHLLLYDYDRNQPADQQIARLVQNMQIGFPADVRVANLSLGVRPFIDTGVRNALDIQKSRVLIVAAAGNERIQFNSENCQILPACLNDLDNVITVIGLNGDLANPAPWTSATQGSNTSPAFDIGAPAEAVLTTVTDNRFARKAGTSFAAPQVAAAASLVFAAGETVFGDEFAGAQLAPKAVKDRLIYTADFFPALSSKVFAGRLNIGRAVKVADAQFILFDGRTVTGQVIEAPEEFACRGPEPGTKFQSWWDVRRLVYNDVRRRHILFRHDDGGHGGREARLDRDASCLVETLTAPVKVQTRAGGAAEVVEFTFGDIRDYTSPLFDE